MGAVGGQNPTDDRACGDRLGLDRLLSLSGLNGQIAVRKPISRQGDDPIAHLAADRRLESRSPLA